MSEEQTVDALHQIVEAGAVSGVEVAIEKVGELSFMQTLALLGESVVDTIVNQESRLEAIRFIAERNQWFTMAEQAAREASVTSDLRKKAALQLMAAGYRESARNLETRFLQQFTQGQTVFADGVRAVFGEVAEIGGKLLGPVAGALFLQHELSLELDKALAAGKSETEAAGIILQASTGFLAISFAEMTSVVTGFINTGTIAGTTISIGATARWTWVVGRAAVSGLVLGLTFEAGYQAGTWLYERPFVNANLADLMDSAIAFMAQNSTATRFPSDVAALAVLTGEIDKELSTDALNRILQASAPTFRDRTELNAVHNALRKLLTPDLDEAATGSSDQLVNDIVVTLRAVKERYTPGQLRLVDLTAPGAALGTVELAKGTGAQALAYRYALRALNSFVVLGDEAIYAPHNRNGELELYSSPQAAPAGMTDQYLADRAQMLAFLITANTNESNAFASNQVNDQVLYQDLVMRPVAGSPEGKPTEVLAFLAGGIPNFRGPNTRVIGFGADSSDVLQGRDNTDRLYGGLGSDLLQGGAGDDYLEGGAGLDVYSYRAETNLLSPNTNDGNDEIRDTDGRGLIRYTFTGSGFSGASSRLIAGHAFQSTPTQWRSADGKFVYDQQGSDLLVSISGDAGGTIMIREFDFAAARTSGYFGIRLLEAPPSIPQGEVRVFLGDKQDFDSNPDAAGIQTLPDGFGNTVRADGQEGRPDLAQANRADSFQGSFADEVEKFDTGGGDDIVLGDGNPADFLLGGRDFIKTGEGRDIVGAGAGADWVEGGTEADLLFGFFGDDVIFGGSAGGPTLALALEITSGETAPALPGRGDLLVGEAGNDVLIGAGTEDLIYGGEDADIIVGGGGNDNIKADFTPVSLSIDWTVGRTVVPGPVTRYVMSISGVTDQGSDSVGGADVIYGGAGDDWVFAGAGNDYVEGGEGADVIFGSAASDVLVGGTGGDVLVGDGAEIDQAGLSGDDYLDGGAGDDDLSAGKGDDYLDGGEGLDTLFGGEGADVLYGGTGTDVLAGGKGKDTYIFNRGDGEEVIVDMPAGGNDPEASVLVLGPGISAADIKFRPGSLMIDVGQGDAVHIQEFNAENPFVARVLDSIQFSDGTVMTYEDVLSRGFDIDGTEGTDFLRGTGVVDRVDAKGGDDFVLGLAGNDVLTGGDGNDFIDGERGHDVLDGGAGADLLAAGDGNDTLEGGAGDDELTGDSGSDLLRGGTGSDVLSGNEGSDTYFFSAGDGIDVVNDDGLIAIGVADFLGTDTIRFADGLAPSGVTLIRRANADLTISYGSGDEITVEGQYANLAAAIERIEFADGSFIDKAQLDALPIAPVTGTAFDDVLVGSEATETLIALEGNDFLDGGPGPDLLQGGAGADRYAVYVGMGADTVVDASPSAAEIGTLQLTGGLTLNSVSAQRLGDDVLVSIRGLTDSIVVKDYYSAAAPGQQWQVVQADGTVMLLDELLARPDPNVDVAALQAKEDYRQSVLSAWAAISADSRTLPTTALVFRSWSQTEVIVTDPSSGAEETQLLAPVSDFSIIAYGVGSGSSVEPLANPRTELTIAPVVLSRSVDDAVISTVGSPTSTVTTEEHAVTLVRPFGIGGGNISTTTLGVGQNVTNSITTSTGESWVRVLLDSGGPTDGVYTILRKTDERVIEEINAGPSANHITGAEVLGLVALIDAGAGADTVQASPFDFVYGNDGNDLLMGGDVVYGGNDDDVLTGGRSLHGGAGNDFLGEGLFMEGGLGDDTLSGIDGTTVYALGADQPGEDTVRDSGGISRLEFENWYYQRLGIELPDESRHLAGMWSAVGENGQALTMHIQHGGHTVGQRNPYYDRDGFHPGEWPNYVFASIDDLRAETSALGLPYRPQDVRLIAPLPPAPPTRANDYVALRPLYASGVIDLDTVEFGDGLTRAELSAVRSLDGDTLDLRWGSANVLHVQLATEEDAIGTGIELFKFGDGTTFDIGQMVASAADAGAQTATPGDDVLAYTDGDDVADGLEGNDQIFGRAGNDSLEGGAGDDYIEGGRGHDVLLGGDGADTLLESGTGNNVLDGGAGNDSLSTQGHSFLVGAAGDDRIDNFGTGSVIVFNPGDGHDTVYAAQGFTLSLGGGIAPTDLVLAEVGNDLVLSIGATDSIRLTREFEADPLAWPEITLQMFGSVHTYDFNAVIQAFYDHAAQNPGTPLALDGVVQQHEVAFSETDALGGALAWQYATTGSTEGLNFQQTLAVLDAPQFGAEAQTIEVAIINQPPSLVTPIADQSAAENNAFSFALPAGTFADPDAGDTLTYSASVAGGPLPQWLSFDPTTLSFSGTPGAADRGSVSLQVQATDSSGAFAFDVVDITVAQTVFTGTDQDDVLIGTGFNDSLSGFGGNDSLNGGAGNDTLDGGAGSDFVLGLAGDDTYRFGFGSEADRVFDGNSEAQAGFDTVRLGAGVTASDVGFRANGSDLILQLAGGADELTLFRFLDETVIDPIDAIVFDDGTPIGFVRGTGGDDALSGTGGIELFFGGAGNDTLSGGLGNDVYVLGIGGGVDSIQDLADASGGNRVLYTGFTLPGEPLLSHSGGQLVISVPASGSTLSIANFNNRDVFGARGVQSFGFSDGSVLTYEELLARGFDIFATGIVSQDFVEGTNIQDRIFGSDQAELLSGLSGDDLLLGGGGGDTLHGDEGNGDTGNDSLDGGAGNDSLFGWKGSDTYFFDRLGGHDRILELQADPGDVDTLVFGAGIAVADLVVAEDALGNLRIDLTGSPASVTFNAWFDPAIPSHVERFVFADGTVLTDAEIEARIPRAPVANADTLSVAEDATTATLVATLLANDTDANPGEALRISAVDTTGTLGTVSFDAATQTLTYAADAAAQDALGAGATAADTFAYTVSDAGGLASTATVTVTVTGANDAPALAAPAADQLATETLEWTYTVPAGTFTDVDSGDTLTWSAVLASGAPLPSWLGFDAASRTFTATPPEDAAGLHMVRVTATDAAGESASDELVLDIANIIVGTPARETLVGTALRDLIIGNGGAEIALVGSGIVILGDSLDGGPGADTLIGGNGASFYSVDDPADVVLEEPGPGAGTLDMVSASISWTLGANLESLRLAGAAPIDGTGNELDNEMVGNSAANRLVGGAGNDRLRGNEGADTLIGGTGNDTYESPDASDQIIEEAGEGIDTVLSTVDWVLGDNLENLTLDNFNGSTALSGGGNALDNLLVGNSFNNSLSGAGGNDTLDGHLGADTMTGGTGDDTYVVAQAGDAVIENAGEGIDTVQAWITYTLGINLENLTLLDTTAINGTGNALNNVLTGNSANNSLSGAGGNDTLDGGAGIDTMTGGAGDDTYVVDHASDVTTESASQGIDTVHSEVTRTLGANLEHLVLTGTAAINGTGNTLANRISGNSANNVLNGGTGADTLTGGLGNDTYVVEVAGDVVTENAGEGIDTVQSSIAWTLGANLENLTLTGTGAIGGTGNALDNAITGNGGNNSLTGGAGNDTLNGGAGTDTMLGGAGDDTYVVAQTADVTTENANEGIDTVQSSVTRTLGNNLENLTLTGTSAINGTGNALDNVITGNTANNSLNGGAGNDTLDGGAGTDTMVGGTGDDTFVVAQSADVTTENANEGIDTVRSSVTRTLGNNLENLILTGTSTINATGNALNNVLTGNGADNVLTGNGGNDTLSGGAGHDSLLGGAGDDVILVQGDGDGSDYVEGGTGIDQVLGSSGDDVIGLWNYQGIATVERIDGGGGVDVIRGTANADTLDFGGTTLVNIARIEGGDGGDLIIGSAGADVIVGGAADDGLEGGAGDDVFLVQGSADGNDGVDGGAGFDQILGSSGDDVIGLWDHQGTRIVERIDGGAGLNIIRGTSGSDRLDFSATTLVNIARIEGGDSDDIIVGSAGDDVILGQAGIDNISGGAGNDVLDGGSGDDVLAGGIGDDTYQLGRGYGADLVRENDATAGNTDIAQFLSGITRDQIWLQQTGNDLVASIIGTNDRFTVENWYLGSANRVEQFRTADGGTLLESNVQNLVNAMAAFAPPAPGQETLPPDYAAALNPVIAANWQ